MLVIQWQYQNTVKECHHPAYLHLHFLYFKTWFTYLYNLFLSSPFEVQATSLICLSSSIWLLSFISVFLWYIVSIQWVSVPKTQTWDTDCNFLFSLYLTLYTITIRLGIVNSSGSSFTSTATCRSQSLWLTNCCSLLSVSWGPSALSTAGPLHWHPHLQLTLSAGPKLPH